jgi:hypothetical protein
VTATCLAIYFVLAVGAHIRTRDFGRNIVNASFLLAFSAVVAITSI